MNFAAICLLYEFHKVLLTIANEGSMCMGLYWYWIDHKWHRVFDTEANSTCVDAAPGILANWVHWPAANAVEQWRESVWVIPWNRRCVSPSPRGRVTLYAQACVGSNPMTQQQYERTSYTKYMSICFKNVLKAINLMTVPRVMILRLIHQLSKNWFKIRASMVTVCQSCGQIKGLFTIMLNHHDVANNVATIWCVMTDDTRSKRTAT